MKADKSKTNTCPACGHQMRLATRTKKVTYKHHASGVPVEAYWCANCDEVILPGNAISMLAKERARLKALDEAVLAPEDVKHIRQDLHLTQEQAGVVLGGGKRAFQKYESGEATPSQAISILLRLLENDPKRLKEVVAFHKSMTRTRKRLTAASHRRYA